MNMPRFTGEASLYKTSGHYRTGRNRGAIHLAARMISPIYPAEINVGHETIPVHSCAPGWTDYGGTCFPDPLTEPSSGSGGDPGEPGGEGGGPGGGVGGGPMTPPKKPRPKRPLRPPRDYHPNKGDKC